MYLWRILLYHTTSLLATLRGSNPIPVLFSILPRVVWRKVPQSEANAIIYTRKPKLSETGRLFDLWNTFQRHYLLHALLVCCDSSRLYSTRLCLYIIYTFRTLLYHCNIQSMHGSETTSSLEWFYIIYTWAVFHAHFHEFYRWKLDSIMNAIIRCTLTWTTVYEQIQFKHINTD